jgi:hypothetical protein
MDRARDKWWDLTARMHNAVNAVKDFPAVVASSLNPAEWRKAEKTYTQVARTLQGTHARLLRSDNGDIVAAAKKAKEFERKAARASVIASALGVLIREQPPVPLPPRKFQSKKRNTHSLKETLDHLEYKYQIPQAITMLGRNKDDLVRTPSEFVANKTTLKDVTLQNTRHKRPGSEKWVPYQQGTEAQQEQWIDAGSMSSRRIPQDSSKKWLYLFHGTTSNEQANLLNGIKKQAAKNTVFDNGFYTTPSPRCAIDYAFTRKKERPQSTAILTVWRIGISRLDSLIYAVDFRIGHHPKIPYYIIFTSDKGVRELIYVETIVMNFEN